MILSMAYSDQHLIQIMRAQQQGGTLTASYADLSVMADMPTMTVRRAVRRLISAGAIVQLRVVGGTSTYYVNIGDERTADRPA